jgi:chromosome segregation ATPase
VLTEAQKAKKAAAPKWISLPTSCDDSEEQNKYYEEATSIIMSWGGDVATVNMARMLIAKNEHLSELNKELKFECSSARTAFVEKYDSVKAKLMIAESSLDDYRQMYDQIEDEYKRTRHDLAKSEECRETAYEENMKLRHELEHLKLELADAEKQIVQLQTVPVPTPAETQLATLKKSMLHLITGDYAAVLATTEAPLHIEEDLKYYN